MKKVNIVTMGCSKNLVDSEHLLKQFEANGFDVAHDSDQPADYVLINTCGFILDAKEESIAMILDYVEAKERGEISKLFVMGCLSARYKDELIAEMPEVDRFFGKFDFEEIMKELKISPFRDLLHDRVLTTPSHYAYLKISEGCDRSCAFCAIPNFTGKHKSVPVEALVEEASNLVKKGVKELLLIAQELTYYGIDLYGKRALPELIEKLSEIEGIEWIRLHYAYPARFPMELLDVIATNPKVCKYLDIPFQHISDPVLSNMNRNVTSEQTRDLIKQIREKVPGIALRTTLIVGYPGETPSCFDELLQFVKEQKFERLGVFPYSHEEDTWAAKHLEDRIDSEEKQRRAELLMQIQQGISEQVNAFKIGHVMKVIIDRHEGEYYIGRTEFDSPEVDGEVLISSVLPLEIGSFANVLITSSDLFDLYGEISD